jgi:hypothetical protein
MFPCSFFSVAGFPAVYTAAIGGEVPDFLKAFQFTGFRTMIPAIIGPMPGTLSSLFIFRHGYGAFIMAASMRSI